MFKEKYNEGKMLRGKAPRNDQAFWKKPTQRPSILKMIGLSNYDRLPELIPVRHFRMSKSPFVFYRATASIMARDLSSTPSPGITAHICGDCHLMNFGAFATPERHLVFDINDFDETNPGPWEWDLKRLVVSFVLAAREKGFDKKDTYDIVQKLVGVYTERLKEFSAMNLLDLWYLKFDLEVLRRESKEQWIRERLSRDIDKANKQTHDRVFYKITSNNMGKFEISDQPPLIRHPVDVAESLDIINAFLKQYTSTLQPDRRWLFEQYKVIDVTLKVVGVGSVGTRCFVVLLLNDNNDPLLIQVKEARESVLVPYTQNSIYAHNGERIVQGQRLIQAASDIFLGWSTGPKGRHFYFRQLRDKKLSPEIADYNKSMLTEYAKLVGGILARAHCKTGKGAVICGYIGKGNAFADAICRFADAYADQTEKDYDDFMKAVKAGKLPVEEEQKKIKIKIER
ncbi:MAG TPA: DUF2252 domain-containing protein [Parafilimonas sp.]|nr:DUF2252 domain-containing protein [Parafilimonas sp.]